MKLNPTETAKAYLAAREALALAEQAKAEAEALLKEMFAQTGTEAAVVDGVKIALVRGERPNYDADALRDLVSPALFKTVTKATVDGKKFKAAVELGKVKADVAEAVTKNTPYEQVRVTEIAGEKSGDKQSAKVA